MDLISIFITFFTVIDPVGTIPVFIGVTAAASKEKKRKMANKAAWVAALVLIFFIVFGELVLNAMQIPISTFQISGGIILFIFSLTMIFGESKADEELAHVKSFEDKAIFPIAVPSLASPGAILAAILLTDNTDYDFLEQSITTLVMLSVVLLSWLAMRFSASIFKLIGHSGAAIISRIMGMILAAVAVSHVLSGFSKYFQL